MDSASSLSDSSGSIRANVARPALVPQPYVPPQPGPDSSEEEEEDSEAPKSVKMAKTEEEEEDDTSADDSDDDDDDESELSELSEDEGEPDESKVVPVSVHTVDGISRTYNVDPDRTTVRRLMKMALAGQSPGYSKKKQRMWLSNGGANATRPLKKSKKLSAYGIGPNQSVTMQYNYQKNACANCCAISCLVTLFILTCGFCCWGCACFRSYRCRRRCERCITCGCC